MNLYKLSQNVNNNYDTWDSMVVVAESAEEAIKIHPHNHDWPEPDDIFYGWAKTPDQVRAKLIGKAADNLEAGTIIIESFNAG